MAYKKQNRQQRIEAKGYKVIFTTSGKVIAKKNTISFIDDSVTGLHKQMFGYG